MVKLHSLSRPAILFNLRHRFEQLHLNPFEAIPRLYGPTQYAQQQQATPADSDASFEGQLPPHVYAVAQRMYRNLVAEDHHRDQSLMISGESVAGKTESTKFVVRFLCQEAGTAATIGGVQSPITMSRRLSFVICDRILATTPISNLRLAI
jgi:myosin heavy subunit